MAYYSHLAQAQGPQFSPQGLGIQLGPHQGHGTLLQDGAQVLQSLQHVSYSLNWTPVA